MPGAGHDEVEEEDAEGSETGESNKEEKLKVVVRVRPLQKNEESWDSASAKVKDATAGVLDADESSAPTSTSLCIQVSSRELLRHKTRVGWYIER